MVEDCFTSVSNGKSAIASAITDKGISTASDATFQTMADNISSIETGSSIATGTVETRNVATPTFTINCGFKPAQVAIFMYPSSYTTIYYNYSSRFINGFYDGSDTWQINIGSSTSEMFGISGSAGGTTGKLIITPTNTGITIKLPNESVDFNYTIRFRWIAWS